MLYVIPYGIIYWREQISYCASLLRKFASSFNTCLAAFVVSVLIIPEISGEISSGKIVIFRKFLINRIFEIVCPITFTGFREFQFNIFLCHYIVKNDANIYQNFPKVVAYVYGEVPIHKRTAHDILWTARRSNLPENPNELDKTADPTKSNRGELRDLSWKTLFSIYVSKSWVINSVSFFYGFNFYG